MTYAIRYPDGTILPAANRDQAIRVAAAETGRSVVLVLDVTTDENDQAEIDSLRKLGPDVGEPAEAGSVAYISDELQRRVMGAVARYPASEVRSDGSVHGLAAVAAIKAVEDWLLGRQAVIR